MNENKIIIVGAGITGLLLANVFSHYKISCILIEKNNLKNFNNNISDGRVSAISRNNSEILQQYNLWELFKEKSCPIEQIRITDNHSPLFLHFDNEIIDGKPLGYMIENHIITSKLIENVQNSIYVEILDNEEIINIKDEELKISAHTKSGKIATGNILIGADGKFSIARKLANIESYDFSYNQVAMVFNVNHEINHNNIAQEIFTKSGPFAILPIQGGFSSAIVWTEKTELAELYLKMNKEDLSIYLSKMFTDYLGKIEISSKIFSYPLSLKLSHNYFKGRICLVGDSAHSIHPIAGQGLNQSMRDIQKITELIKEHLEIGLDIGSKILLTKYQKARRADNYAMIIITDSLNRLFSNNLLPLKMLRKLGLGTINNIPFMQKFFMKYAMGKR